MENRRRYLNMLRKMNLQEENSLLDKENFDIFGGMVYDNKLKILANKKHREIEREVFDDCTSLRDIHSHILEIENCNINPGAFDNFDCDNCTLYVPAGTAETYKAHEVFGKFKNIVEE